MSPNVSLLCSNMLLVGVKKLLGSSTNSLGRTRMWCSSIKSHWRKRLSIILQKCNARVLLKTLSRLSCDNIVADDLFDFDIQYQVH